MSTPSMDVLSVELMAAHLESLCLRATLPGRRDRGFEAKSFDCASSSWLLSTFLASQKGMGLRIGDFFRGCPHSKSPTIWGQNWGPLIFGNSHRRPLAGAMF